MAPRPPAVPSTRADESLESFVRRLLDTNGWRPNTLTLRTKGAVHATSLLHVPSARAVRALSALTRQSPDSIRLLAMSSLTPVVPELGWIDDAPIHANVVARQTWYWPTRTQACPACLAEAPSIWHLRWRLPYVVGCTQHQTLLLHRCPRCQASFHADRGLHDGRRPTFDGSIDQCADCGYEISHGPTRELTDRETAYTHAISAVLRSRPEPPSRRPADRPGAEALEALRCLAGLQQHIHHLTHDSPATHDSIAPGIDEEDAVTFRRFVIASPHDPDLRAHLLTTAWRWLTVDERTAVDELALLIRSAPRVYGLQGWIRDHTNHSRLAHRLLGQAVARLQHPSRLLDRKRNVHESLHDVELDDIELPPSHNIPQLVPPEIWNAVRASTVSGRIAGPAYASLCLARTLVPGTWTDVGDAFGYPPELTTRIARTGSAKLVVTPFEWMTDLFEAVEDHWTDEPGELKALPDYRYRDAVVRLAIYDPYLLRDAAKALQLKAPPRVLAYLLWEDWARGHPEILRSIAGGYLGRARLSYNDYKHHLGTDGRADLVAWADQNFVPDPEWQPVPPGHRRWWHLAGPGWTPGQPLLCREALALRDGQPPPWHWPACVEGIDGDRVCLLPDSPAGRRAAAGHQTDSHGRQRTILRVDLPEAVPLTTSVIEPFSAVIGELAASHLVVTGPLPEPACQRFPPTSRYV